MPQQINLFSPILLTPKRYFSARTMAQALGLFGAALVLISGWTVWRTHALAGDIAAATPLQTAEKQRLEAKLATLPGAGQDMAALQQELVGAERQLAERQQLLDTLARGNIGSPVALLRRLGDTLPTPIWLTELKLAEGQLQLDGLTLQPEALQPWLARWSQDPDGKAAAPALVRVQRQDAADAGRAETWAFRIVHAHAASTGGTP